MFYFNSLPIINYSEDQIRDIFKQIVIVSELDNDWFDYYRMTEDETFHDVSNKLYGSVNYWWILCLVNGVKDYHYDTNVNDEILQKLAKDLQILELESLRDYILIPKNSTITTVVEGVTVEGQILDKYVNNDKFYIDVRLSDIYKRFPEETIVTTDQLRISKVTLSSSSIYNLGDLVRQDFSTATSIEDFVRGYVVEKSYNNVWVYKTKINDFLATGTNVTIDGKVTTATKLIPVYKKSASSTFGDIISSENIVNFNVKNSREYRLNYLDRYDNLTDLNNKKSVVKVIKKQYLNSLQNAILTQLG